MNEKKFNKRHVKIRPGGESEETIPRPEEELLREEGAPVPDEPELEDPRDMEIRDLKEQLKRISADYENARKRMEEEYRRRKQLAETGVLKELLEVMDNLERALESSDKGADAPALREGLELILRQMRGILEKYGVKVIEAKGNPFDPNFHEAVMREHSDEDEGIVLEEMRKGYCIDDQVLRPCMVKVAYKA